MSTPSIKIWSANPFGSGGGGAVPVFIVVVGTLVAPTTLDGTTALPISSPAQVTNQFNFIASTGGAVTMSANPQLDPATAVGKTIILTGTSDTDTVTFISSATLVINGNWTARNGSMLSVFWDGNAYREASRNDI